MEIWILVTLFLEVQQKKEQEKRKKETMQEWALKVSREKCEEIVSRLAFLEEYGFTLTMMSGMCDDYKSGKLYGYMTYMVKMSLNGRHFAMLYPLVGNGTWPFYSYQLDMRGAKHYTYEEAVKTISERVRIG